MRLARVSYPVVQKAIKGLEGEEGSSFCRECVLGKQHRDPFPKEPRLKEDIPGAVIHADLFSPITPVIYGGNKHFLLIKDDATSFMFVYPIREKTQVLDRFKQFILEWRKLTTHKIKHLRTDNGTEFVAREVEAWLREKEIFHELTVPHCPEMNGFIERSNRTVAEAARSMLHGAKVPKSLWAEAVCTAVYMLNRVPCNALNFKCPYAELTGQPPNLHHIRVFGSTGYVHIPDGLRNGKWDGKSKTMTLLGYNEDNGSYRMYDSETKRVHISRHVKFDEKFQSEEPMTINKPDTNVQDSSSPSSRGCGTPQARGEGSPQDLGATLPPATAPVVAPQIAPGFQRLPAISNGYQTVGTGKT